ncbi:MAG: hypothetical protein J6Q79_08500 [Clostridia bacterium]|nr:hypothetical protein [Clostridia bacterium]
MFLLKEAYDKEGNIYSWDEAKWLNQEKYTDNCIKKVKCSKCTITGNTFNFIATVIYGITESHTKEFDSWLGLKNQNTT